MSAVCTLLPLKYSSNYIMSLPKRMPQKSSRVATASGTEHGNSDKRVILNRYQVERKLGSGNFGTAYLVVDLKTTSLDDSL